MTFITESNQSKQPDCLDVRVLLSDVDLAYGAEISLALRVRRDFPDGSEVGILLLHPAPLLSSFRTTVFVLEGAPDGAGVRVLLTDLEDSLRAPHLDRFVRSTLNSSLVRPWAALIIGKTRSCYFGNYWNLIFFLPVTCW